MDSELTIETLSSELADDRQRWPESVSRFRSVSGIPLYQYDLPVGEIQIDEASGQVTLLNGATPNKKPPENWSAVRRWAVSGLTFALPRLESETESVRELAEEYVRAVLTDLPLWASHFDVAIEPPGITDRIGLAQLIEKLRRPSEAPEFLTTPVVVQWLKNWKYEGPKGKTFVRKASLEWGDPVETRCTRAGKVQSRWLYSRAYRTLCRQFPGASFPEP